MDIESMIPQEDPNKNKKKKKKSTILAIVVVISALAIGVGVYLLLGEYVFNKGKDKKGANKPDVEEKADTDVTDEAVRARLSRFVKAASFNDSKNTGVFLDLAHGLGVLNTEQKVLITYYSLVKIDHAQTPIGELPDKYYRIDIGMNYVDELDIEAFNNEYRNLFIEEPTYDIEAITINGCPAIYKIDTELGKIYLNRECSEALNSTYVNSIGKITTDDEFYYVYQYIGEADYSSSKPVYKTIRKKEVIDVDSFIGNEDKFETLIWVFSKDFKFLGTSKTK